MAWCLEHKTQTLVAVIIVIRLISGVGALPALQTLQGHPEHRTLTSSEKVCSWSLE